MNFFLCSSKINSIIVPPLSRVFGRYIYPLNILAFFVTAINYVPNFLDGMKVGSILSIPSILFLSMKDKETIKEMCSLDHPTEMIITGPIIEEIEFRYILQQSLINIFSPYFDENACKLLSISSTSFLFGMSHIACARDAKDIVLHCSYAEIIGFFLGVIMDKYGLWSSIAAHSTYNAMVFLSGSIYCTL
jgi:hypothetical protein